eukprot:m.104304 g.104304  ORF g.104304 m.104304 type:complete len:1404 (+) comp13258_c0_seq3:837-5048(+)
MSRERPRSVFDSTSICISRSPYRRISEGLITIDQDPTNSVEQAGDPAYEAFVKSLTEAHRNAQGSTSSLAPLSSKDEQQQTQLSGEDVMRVHDPSKPDTCLCTAPSSGRWRNSASQFVIDRLDERESLGITRSARESISVRPFRTSLSLQSSDDAIFVRCGSISTSASSLFSLTSPTVLDEATGMTPHVEEEYGEGKDEREGLDKFEQQFEKESGQVESPGSQHGVAAQAAMKDNLAGDLEEQVICAADTAEEHVKLDAVVDQKEAPKFIKASASSTTTSPDGGATVVTVKKAKQQAEDGSEIAVGRAGIASDEPATFSMSGALFDLVEVSEEENDEDDHDDDDVTVRNNPEQGQQTEEGADEEDEEEQDALDELPSSPSRPSTAPHGLSESGERRMASLTHGKGLSTRRRQSLAAVSPTQHRSGKSFRKRLALSKSSDTKASKTKQSSLNVLDLAGPQSGEEGLSPSRRPSLEPVIVQESDRTIVSDGETKELVVLTVNGKQVVSAGTSVALLEYLLSGKTITSQSAPKPFGGLLQRSSASTSSHSFASEDPFLREFILSFRSFLTPETFMQVLLNQISKRRDDEEMVGRCIDIVSVWIALAWRDFQLEPTLVISLMQLLSNASECNCKKQQIEFLRSMVQDRQESDPSHAAFSPFQEYSSVEPTVSLISMDPTELGEQITYFDWKLFHAVTAVDLLVSSEQSVTGKALAQLTRRFDQEYFWVEDDICKLTDTKLQSSIIEKFIYAAATCKQLNNFFSVFTIVGALSTTKVSKLKEAWELVSRDAKKLLARLETLTSTDRNMKNYRAAAKKCSHKTCLPFLPIVTKDLRFMGDGLEKRVEGLINFQRLSKMANYTQSIVEQFQMPFKKLMPEEPIQRYIQFTNDSIATRLRTNGTYSEDSDTSEREALLEMKVTELTAALEESNLHISALQKQSTNALQAAAAQYGQDRAAMDEERVQLLETIRNLQYEVEVLKDRMLEQEDEAAHILSRVSSSTRFSSSESRSEVSRPRGKGHQRSRSAGVPVDGVGAIPLTPPSQRKQPVSVDAVSAMHHVTNDATNGTTLSVTSSNTSPSCSRTPSARRKKLSTMFGIFDTSPSKSKSSKAGPSSQPTTTQAATFSKDSASEGEREPLTLSEAVHGVAISADEVTTPLQSSKTSAESQDALLAENILLSQHVETLEARLEKLEAVHLQRGASMEKLAHLIELQETTYIAIRHLTDLSEQTKYRGERKDSLARTKSDLQSDIDQSLAKAQTRVRELEQENALLRTCWMLADTTLTEEAMQKELEAAKEMSADFHEATAAHTKASSTTLDRFDAMMTAEVMSDADVAMFVSSRSRQVSGIPRPPQNTTRPRRPKSPVDAARKAGFGAVSTTTPSDLDSSSQSMELVDALRFLQPKARHSVL